jgi:hypothetical protein
MRRAANRARTTPASAKPGFSAGMLPTIRIPKLTQAPVGPEEIHVLLFVEFG